MDPFAPAEAVMVSVSMAKEASIVWLAVTPGNVYLATAPMELPSTLTSETW